MSYEENSCENNGSCCSRCLSAVLLCTSFNENLTMRFEIEGTSHSLLAGIKRGDEVSWVRFLNVYRPLVWMLGEKYRFNTNEKEELMQQVVNDFFNAQDKFTYDPSKGSFRGYLYTVIRNRITAMARERKIRRSELHLENEEALEHVIDNEGLQEGTQWEQKEAWDREWRIHIVTQAREEIKSLLEPRIIQIFDQWHEQCEDPKIIAKRFSISLATFYNYKKQVLEALKACILSMEEYQ